jgi:hypothetical protein
MVGKVEEKASLKTSKNEHVLLSAEVKAAGNTIGWHCNKQ